MTSTLSLGRISRAARSSRGSSQPPRTIVGVAIMQRYTRTWFATLSLALVATVGPARAALACPFCSAASQTFSEELATMDVAVIAKLVKLPPQSSKAGDEIQK